MEYSNSQQELEQIYESFGGRTAYEDDFEMERDNERRWENREKILKSIKFHAEALGHNYDPDILHDESLDDLHVILKHLKLRHDQKAGL